MQILNGFRRGTDTVRAVCLAMMTCLSFSAAIRAQDLPGTGPAPDFIQTAVPAVVPAEVVTGDDRQQIVLTSAVECAESYCGSDSYCGNSKNHWTDVWDGGFEVGLNGSEGDARNVNLVLGFDAKRESGLDTTTIDIDYLFSRDDVETTKNRLYSLARQIRDIPNSRWGTFGDLWFEWDELENFRSRLGLHGGGIYTFQDTEELVLKGLIGLGTSKEMRGMNDHWRPEAFIGSLVEKQLTCRQSCYIKSIYYPDVTNTDDFRINVRAGWDYALSQERDVKLSLSAFNRYDSAAAAGDRKNNIDYWASLIWAF